MTTSSQHDDHNDLGDALALAAAIREGRTSAVEVVRRTLARIGELDERIRAYVHVDGDGAMAAARSADVLLAGAGTDGVPPFHGVPLSIKDVIDVAGMPTTHSSRALAHHVAATDDPLVRRFRQAGFIIVGKTNVPEFCTSMTASRLNGISRNPWNLDLTPGGSSGGAAAALAAGMCAVAHGTDGAGSTRVPASFCGLVGLKPSRQLVAFAPHERNQYFGTSEPGVLARSVRDAATVLDVMVGTGSPGPAWSPRPAEPYATAPARAPGRLRIAVCTDPRSDGSRRPARQRPRAPGTSWNLSAMTSSRPPPNGPRSSPPPPARCPFPVRPP